MKVTSSRLAVSVSILVAIVALTSCRQVPEERAASDKYRLVWNDDPTSTMTVMDPPEWFLQSDQMDTRLARGCGSTCVY